MYDVLQEESSSWWHRQHDRKPFPIWNDELSSRTTSKHSYRTTSTVRSHRGMERRRWTSAAFAPMKFRQGIPSRLLLERRPTFRQAEAQLIAAANAQIESGEGQLAYSRQII